MGLALENIGQRDGRSAHIAVFGSSLVELPQVYRAAADRYDLIEVDIGLLPAPRRVGCRRRAANVGTPHSTALRLRHGAGSARPPAGYAP